MANTLIGGNGVDTLYGTQDKDLFVIKSGNDKTLYNIGGEDTISISGTLKDNCGISGDDVILQYNNGSVKVKNGIGKYLTVVDSKGKHQKVFSDFVKSPQTVIQEFMASLDKTTLQGSAALDQAVKACSNFSSMQDVINNMISDCKNAADAETFLRDKCGIIIDNGDTGAITGWDMGGKTIKNAENLVPESGSYDSFSDDSFTVKGLKVKLAQSLDSLEPVEQQIWRGMYTWWMNGALNLISASYGDNFSFDKGSATVKEITVNFINEDTNAPAATIATIDGGGRAVDLELRINMKYWGSLDEKNVNGLSDVKTIAYLDQTLAHELTHAVMMANICHFKYLPLYIKEGMADFTGGKENRPETEVGIRELASDSSKLKQVFDTGASPYDSGYILLKYLSHQAANQSGVTYNGTSGNDNISTGNRKTSIDAGTGNDTVNVTGSNLTVLGGAGDDRISLSSNGNLIQFGLGEGNDTIYNYSSNDTIQLYNGAIISTSTVGNDVAVKVYGGSITLKDAAGQKFTTKVGYTPEGIYNTAEGKSIGGTSSGEFINNTAAKVTINGNGGDDTIHSGSKASLSVIDAGAGNDLICASSGYETIDGGAGNDTVYADISNLKKGRVYKLNVNSGSDVVFGYNSTDTINITDGSSYSTTKSGSDVIIKAGSAQMTLKNASSQKLNINKTVVIVQTKIVNTKANTLVNGTANGDIISLGGNRAGVTVDGRGGNDTIYGDNAAHRYLLGFGSGNDTVYNYNSNDSIGLYSGVVYSHSTAGNDVIVKLANDSLTLKNANGKKLNIISYTAPGSNNQTANTIVSGTSSANFISNLGEKVTIRAGSGNDTVFNGAGANNTAIYGDAGNDVFYNYGANNETLIGGAGNDTIYNWNSGSTKRVYKYSAGDGNDVIFNYGTTDTVRIPDKSIYSTVKSGTDQIVKFVDGGSMTFKGSSDKKLNIVGGQKLIASSTANKLVSGTGGNDVISLTGSKAGVTIVGGAGNDLIYGDSAAHVYQFGIGYGNDTIINYNSKDTLYFLPGALAPASTIDNDVIVTVYGGTVTLKDAAGKDINRFSGYSPKGIYNTEASAVVNGTSSGELINNTASKATINGGAGNDTIHSGSKASLSAINGGAGNDLIFVSSGYETIDGGTGNDTVRADFTRALKGRVYKTQANGGKDIVLGYTANDTVRIADGSPCSTTKSGSDLIVKVGSTAQMTLKNAADKKLNLVGNGKYISNKTKNKTVTGTSNKDSITNNASNVTINGNAGADTIQSYGNYVSVMGGSGNDSIKSTGGSNVTLYGGAGNDTLTGSSSAEVFQVRSDGGKDVITNFGANDSVKSAHGQITKFSTSGNDYILKFDDPNATGTVTLKNVAQNYSVVKSGSIIKLKSKGSSSQLPASDNYWFLNEPTVEENPLNEIVATDHAVELDTDFENELLKRSTHELISVSARHRRQK